jgi:hypothetical protein
LVLVSKQLKLEKKNFKGNVRACEPHSSARGLSTSMSTAAVSMIDLPVIILYHQSLFQVRRRAFANSSLSFQGLGQYLANSVGAFKS